MELCCGLAVRRRDIEGELMMKHGRKVLLRKRRGAAVET
jgi:hypothetical protein